MDLWDGWISGVSTLNCGLVAIGPNRNFVRRTIRCHGITTGEIHMGVLCFF